MVTMAKRLEELRTERNLSRPALAAALGFPRTAIEKFETGRQTPSQDQQEKMAAYFGVSLFYLRGESTDRTSMEDWMDGAFQETAPAPAPVPRPVKAAKAALGGWDPTEGALYYWNPATATSSWIWSRPIIARIGNHVFAK